MTERVTSAREQYLAATGSKKRRVQESRRGAEPGNPYRGMACRVCGKRVKVSEPAQFYTAVHADGSEERWAAHLSCVASERRKR